MSIWLPDDKLGYYIDTATGRVVTPPQHSMSGSLAMRYPGGAEAYTVHIREFKEPRFLKIEDAYGLAEVLYT